MNRMNLFALVIALTLAGCGRASAADAQILPHPYRAEAQIEYFIRQPEGAGPWPTVVFLHGHQSPMSRPGGAVFVNWGVLDRFAQNGYLAVSVSLPGYGGSDGPEDFAGPFTQKAVVAVLDKLEADVLADPEKILIQGVSLGAITGALVAAKDTEIAGLVLISGLYDLPAYFAQSGSPGAAAVKAALDRQTGGDEAALVSRSVLPVASNIRAATLILNGAQDDRTDPDQARRLADIIGANGVTARARIYPEFGHEIPVRARDAEIDAFIAETLGAHALSNRPTKAESS